MKLLIMGILFFRILPINAQPSTQTQTELKSLIQSSEVLRNNLENIKLSQRLKLRQKQIETFLATYKIEDITSDDPRYFNGYISAICGPSSISFFLNFEKTEQLIQKGFPFVFLNLCEKADELYNKFNHQTIYLSDYKRKSALETLREQYKTLFLNFINDLSPALKKTKEIISEEDSTASD